MGWEKTYDAMKPYVFRIESESGTRPLPEVLKELYPQAPSISIDYGIMEKSNDVVVMKAVFDWNDVGSWEFIRDINDADGDGNVSVGESVMIDGGGNTVVSPDRMGVISLTPSSSSLPSESSPSATAEGWPFASASIEFPR